MKSALGSAILVPAICLSLNVSAPGAETNFWLKATNGFWHQAEWSLGIFPRASQSVALVSTQSKTLVISAVTARDRPNTLQISNLFVFAPHHSINHLFLSRIGLSSPLRVGDVFNLSENAVLTLLDSTLRVGREFQVNSTVNHGGGSRVIAADLHVGAGLTAYYNFTNGLISAPKLFVGHKSPATFHQYGGRVVAGSMEVREANYSLHAGDIFADSLMVAHLYEPAVFHHRAGNLTVTNTIDIAKYNGHGRYFLTSGILKAGGLRVRGSSMSFSQRATGTGEFTQTGGSNLLTSLTVGRYYFEQGPGIYRLSGGLLAHRGGTAGDGGFEQSGGIHRVDGQFSVHGVYGSGGRFARGQYTLEAGSFSSRDLSIISGGVFIQRGGTNEVTESMRAEGAGVDFGYKIIGGKLVSTNVATHEKGFRQTGGIHEIRGFLSLADFGDDVSPSYELSGGDLSIANGAYLGRGAVFRRTGGTLRQRGTITFSGGRWECGPGEQHLGALQLDATSTITLPRAPAVLHLGSSAAMTWVPEDWARLVIVNWSGSENGGPHQIFFGTNANGLTTQQLAQVRFRNPPGYAPGDYPATILPRGEVVPILPARPQLAFTWALARTNMIHFHFSDGLILQAATNISGPFIDLPALSPFPIVLTNGPRRFFRLREP